MRTSAIKIGCIFKFGAKAREYYTLIEFSRFTRGIVSFFNELYSLPRRRIWIWILFLRIRFDFLEFQFQFDFLEFQFEFDFLELGLDFLEFEFDFLE